MKIAYNYKIFWNQRYGGISRYFINIFNQLETNNHLFRVFAPFFKNEYLNDFSRKNIEGSFTKDNIPFTSNLLKMYNEIICLKKIESWKPDLVHYTYYYNKLKKKRSTVITVYDLIHEKIANKDNKIIRPKKNMIEISDHIICISESTKKDLQKFYNVDDKKISIIYLGVNHLIKTKYENFPKFLKEDPYLLYIGSREKYKNFDFFIKSFSKSKKLMENFNIILFGGGSITKQEKQILRSLKVDENKIKQVNGGDDMLINLYQNAKAFVFPSLYEGFGLPILESIRNKCPVICSDIPVFREVAGDLVNFFNPENCESLINSIESVVFSDNVNENSIKDSKKITEQYNWEKCSKKTFEVYKKIIN
jgi:glycosyltransferase involved in cell wall biosynthesis